MKKILVLNCFEESIHRGAEVFTKQLLKHLQKDYKTIWVAGQVTQAAHNRFDQGFFQNFLKRLFLDNHSRLVLLFTLGALKKIIQEKPSLVIPLNGFWQLFILKILQIFLHFKILVIGHAGPGWDDRFNLYLHPDVFVPLSPINLKWARKTCSYTRSVMIPLAVDDCGDCSKRSSSRPLVLVPAALVAYKKIDLVIKAMTKVPQAHLLVLGEGEMKKTLTNMADRLLDGRAQIKHVSHDQIGKYYQQANLVVLVSLDQENTPLVFLEALSYRVPVVARNTPRNSWILGSAGLLVDNPEVSTQLSSAIKKALAKKDWNFESLDKFNWKLVVAQYRSLINQVLGGSVGK